MKIGILGSGMVGQALGNGLIASGYKVMIGTRDKNKLGEWKSKAGENASIGSFEETASFGEMLFLCCKWTATQNVINLAGNANFSGKIVIDVTNPLIFEENNAPKLALGYPESAGAKVQDWLPDSKVVKSFNTVTANYMANPKLKEGTPDLFIAGNDGESKKLVSEIAEKWAWKVNDLGDINQSYLLESLAMIWIRYGFLNNHWTHAFKLLRE